MRAYIVRNDSLWRTDRIEDVRAAVMEKRSMWVVLERRTPELDALLAETFHIHPVTAEDIWTDRVIPKAEVIGDNLHIMVQGVMRKEVAGAVGVWGANIVLGETFIITHRRGQAPWSEPPGCQALLAESPARLAHAFLDQIVDEHVAVAEELGLMLDAVEGEISARSRSQRRDAGQLEGTLLQLRRSTHTLERLTRRQLAAITVLVEKELAAVPAATIPYFRDVLDHFTRVADLVDDEWRRINDSLESLGRAQSDRMNSVMKTLTVLSTVMLPLNFIASAFGMNFRSMPLIANRHGFASSVVLMTVCAASLVAVFWRRGWLFAR